MGAFAATDVTLTIANRDKQIFGPPPAKKAVIGQVVFGDDALTYATGGVPMPAKEQWGFKLEVTYAEVEQPYGNGFIYKFDRTNHKLKIFTQGFVTSDSGSSDYNGLDTFTAYYVENSLGDDTVLHFAGATITDTTYDTGPMIELPNGLAPAEVTLKIMMVGE